MNRVKPIADREGLDFTSSFVLPSGQNEFVQIVLIVVNRSLRLALSIALVERESVLDVVICQPAKRRLAAYGVEDVLLNEVETPDLAPRRCFVADLGDKAKSNWVLDPLAIARPDSLVAPEIGHALSPPSFSNPSLFSHWTLSSGSQGLLGRLYAVRAFLVPPCPLPPR